jgi:hypothetical protein
MRRSIGLIAGAFFFIGLAGTARAEAPLSEVAFGPVIGTPGIGIQVSAPLWPKYLNITSGFTAFGYTYHATTDGQGYRAKIKLGGVPVYLSAFPFGSNFHLDAGIFINNNRISLNARPSTGRTYTFNRHVYSVGDLGMVSGGTQFNRVAPYFGIGWGDPFIGSKWTFTANAGVILEGGVDARLTAANEAAVSGAAADIAVAQHMLNSKVGFLTAFPVVDVGLTYRF